MHPVTAAAIGMACLAVACGGSTVATGTTCGPGTMLVNGQCYSNTLIAGGDAGVDADATDIDSGEIADTGPDSVNPLCEMPGGSEITFKDTTDAQAHLVGRWILCSGPGLTFATEQHDQAGVEFAADMTWYALHQEGSALTRAGGFGASGTYRFPMPADLDFGPSSRIDLYFGVPSSFANLTMLDSPRKMRAQFGSPPSDTPSIYARESL